MFVALKLDTTAPAQPFNQARAMATRIDLLPSTVGFELTVPRFTLPFGISEPQLIFWTADGASGFEEGGVFEPAVRSIVKARVVRTRKGVPTLE